MSEEEKEQGREWQTKLGRPMKFNAEKAITLMEQEIERYLNTLDANGRYFEALPTNENGGFTYKGKPLVSLGTIALKCGVVEKTLHDHAHALNEDGSLKNEQLFLTYEQFKELCKIRLLEGGMAGAYNSNFVSFVANVAYGMIPKNQVEQTVEIKSLGGVFKDLDEVYNREQERQQAEKMLMLNRKAELDAMGED